MTASQYEVIRLTSEQMSQAQEEVMGTRVKFWFDHLPLKSRLLCEMTYSGFEGYVPFAQQQYQPLTEEDEAIGFATSVGDRSYD